MNTNVQMNTSRSSFEIARVAFSMFVYIADADKSITAQDVRRFQTLIRETAWVDSDELRDALETLQQNYSTFWANYEDGIFSIDASSIAECFDRACHDLSDERALHLKRSLRRFLDKLDGSISIKLVQGSDQRPRSQARKELLAILDRSNEQTSVQSMRRDPVASETVTALAPSTSLGPIVPLAPAASQKILRPPAVAPAAALWPAAKVSPDQMPIWNGKTKVRCVSAVWETDDTKTYSFAADPPTLFHYKPGQFISIEVPLPGSVLRRIYTISSSPSRPYTLSITVKKVQMGWMSNWLFDNMVAGVECTISGPAGKFTCLEYPSAKLFFLAAGSGITPSMSMLRWLADTSSPADIVFINNVRSPDDIIFHQELLHMSTRLSGRIRLAIVPTAVSPARPWHGPVGRLEEMLVRTYAPDFAERETFVCGPPGYMAAAKSMLIAMGLPMAQYHDESFGVVPVATAAVVPTATSASPLDPTRRTGAPPTAPATVVANAVPTVSLPTLPSPSRAAPSSVARAPTPSTLASSAAAPFRDPKVNNAVGVSVPATAERAAAATIVPVASPGVARSSSAGTTVRMDLMPSPAAAKPPFSSMPAVAKLARISLHGSNDGFAAQPGETILDAADGAGVTLAYSCRAGICGACKMRKVSGRVEMSDQNILSQAEIDSGYVLTCVGKAAGDVTLMP
jgi:ferredoxin-NADP reductase/ferredoxin